MSNHVYLCGGYIVPRAEQDTFELLRKEIEHFSNLGTICLIGDYNSRTASSQPIQYRLDLDNPDFVSPVSVPIRNSVDTVTNENGRKLLDIATNYDILIGNGCIMGDLEGQFTCCSWNGSSTNDLFLFHRELYNQINYFKVDDEFHWYSDHRSISFSLQINLLLRNSKHSKKMETSS